LDDIPLGILFGALLALIALSAFFSAAEIGLMTLNRYRLRILAEQGRRGARLALGLLERPDRLLGVILLGNNAVNIAASFVASLLTLRLFGEKALAAAAGLLTFAILVFAEVAPKTLAALHPERVALPAAYLLHPLLRVFYPLVWLVNVLANLVLRALGARLTPSATGEVTTEELRAIVREAEGLVPGPHQEMLLALLDLEKMTVDDVMVPRGRIEGIDLEAEWGEIVQQISNARYTRLPVYRGSLDNIVGILHARRVLPLLREGRLDRDSLLEVIEEPYFIPAGTSLQAQLLHFRENRRRMALVVDEYGDIQGLVTLEEILEEIVGDFTSRARGGAADDVQPQPDGSYLVRGSASLRDLKRRLGWQFPSEESRTLNGLVLEYLEHIPEPGTSLMIGGYLVEILRTSGTAIEIARVRPAATPATPAPAAAETAAGENPPAGGSEPH
jgi:Mg2+/Co2+ transporter CorB